MYPIKISFVFIAMMLKSMLSLLSCNTNIYVTKSTWNSTAYADVKELFCKHKGRNTATNIVIMDESKRESNYFFSVICTREFNLWFRTIPACFYIKCAIIKSTLIIFYVYNVEIY